MAPKDKQGTNSQSLALTPDTAAEVTALAVGGVDQLAGVEGFDALDIEDDGLSEVDHEDIKLPAKVFNFKGTQANGDPIMANQFYDTLTGDLSRELNVILIKTHKTNEWREYNEAEKKNEVMCRSFDRVMGTVAKDCSSHTGARLTAGTERPCESCPDAEWYQGVGKNGQPKRMRDCGPVHNVFMVELPSMTPCVIRFRRTSLPVIQQYISRHHFGKRPVRDQKTGRVTMGNYPLFSFASKITLKMSEDRQPYAIPVMERGAVLPPQLIQQGADTAKYVNDVLLRELHKIVDAPDQGGDDAGGGGGADTSFDPAAMGGSTGGGEGQDFTS